jgi:hypothetical protein
MHLRSVYISAIPHRILMTSALATRKNIYLETSIVIFCQGSLKPKIENPASNKIENQTFDKREATFANRNLDWWSSDEGSNYIAIKKNAAVCIYNNKDNKYSKGFLNANIAIDTIHTIDTIECKYFKIINPKPLFSAAIAQHQTATAIRMGAHPIPHFTPSYQTPYTATGPIARN